MRKEYEVLGNHIRVVDVRNQDLQCKKLLGVSIEKRFMHSIANIVGTDLSNYKIVAAKTFNFFPRTPHIENLVILERV